MAKKKKVKARAMPKEKQVGFFERNKDVLSEAAPQKSVR